MLQTLLSSLRVDASNDRQETKRRYPRRYVDRCVAVVHGRTFPVENWSLGGLLLQADDRLFGNEEDLGITIKFKLRNNILDINHSATVVRKSNGKVALRLEPLSQTTGHQFQQVIDDSVAEEFAVSQA